MKKFGFACLLAIVLGFSGQSWCFCPDGVCGDFDTPVDAVVSSKQTSAPTPQVKKQATEDRDVQIDVDNEVAEALQAFKDVFQSFEEGGDTKVFIPFSQKVFSRGTPVVDVLRRNGLVGIFDPPVLSRTLVLKEDMVFTNLGDLASYLEQAYRVFTTFKNGHVYISVYQRKVYNIDFISSFISKKSIKELLHGKKSYAKIFPEVGRLEVYDDIVGHRNVARYIEELARRVRRVYYYEVAVLKAGIDEPRPVDEFKGETISGTPVPLGDAGFLKVLPGKERAMVQVAFPEFPSRVYSFLVERKGGSWQARDGKYILRVRLKIKGTTLCKEWKQQEF